MKKTFYNIFEAKDKGACFTFGRFNPPTTGHAKLVDRLIKVSKGFQPIIFTSHSNDKRKNPLSHKDKIKYLRLFFGRKVDVVDSPSRTIFNIVHELYEQGYKNIRMVVGSDRVREFDVLIKKYNSVKARHGFYNFDNIEVVSAGERDPDADDVSGMSASKMRQYAEDGDFDNFKQGVPKSGAKHAEKLYKAVRKGMGINEGNLPHYMVEDLITEGVYDQGIFKAVFLMGGPGSGKSAIVKALHLKSLGLRLVNTDAAFERGLKKAGHSLDLRTMDAIIRDPIRARAKEITGKQLDGYIGGRLGLIFDTTSAKRSKIQTYKKMLDKLGYEYKMIYVNTSLANAQDRNSERARKLPEKIVQADWENAQKNVKAFKGMFGKDFVEVKNDDTYAAFLKKASKLFGSVMTWASKFPSNKEAVAWKEFELLKKANAGKNT
jgi:predicted kinase